MKKSGSKMKESTKKLLIICLVCLVLGIGFVTVGMLKGPSSWAYWNGQQAVTSNAVGTYGDKREVEAFSSLEIGIPTGQCIIREGDTFSVDYKSSWPGVKPILKQENGRLSLVAESFEYVTVMITNPIVEMIANDNYIIITVPKGTKLDQLVFSQHSDWNYNTIDFYMWQQILLENITARELKSETGFYHKAIDIKNCMIDTIDVNRVSSLHVNGLQADTIRYLMPENWQRYDWGFTGNNVTANSLTLDNELYNREKMLNTESFTSSFMGESSGEISVSLSSSNIGTLDVVGDIITLSKVTTQKATILASGSLKATDSTLQGESILRSGGQLLLNTEQNMADFNGLVACGFGYQEGIVTEYADYGTPEYAHGYVTQATKEFGIRSISITQEQYYAIKQQLDQYNYHAHDSSGFNDDVTFLTQYDGFEPLTGEDAQYNEAVEVNQDYDDETGEMRFTATIYNRKLVRYYIDHTGNKVFLSNLGQDQTILYVNGEAVTGLRHVLQGSGANKLDIYARGTTDISFAG